MASSYFMLKCIRRKRERKQQNKTIEPQLKTSDDKCRVCLKYGNISIYSTENTQDISEAIQIFGDIEINKNDEFPKHLCDTCYSLLQGAILFRKSAKNSDVILRQSYAPNEQNDSEISVPNSNNDVPLEVYSCKLCKHNFDTFNEYVVHKNSKQHRRIRIQCQICHRLLTVQLYKKHLARHQTASHLICDVCGKLYRKDNLIRHLQLHSYNLPFQCQICPYRGRFMESLKIHMRTHSGDKPFTCNKCELRFLTRSNLNRHLLTHKKERPHKCVECGRGFYTKGDMDVHFKSDHAGIKDFGCRLCGNKYGTRKALMRHELRVHKRDKMAKGRMPLYLQAEYRK